MAFVFEHDSNGQLVYTLLGPINSIKMGWKLGTGFDHMGDFL
jgi:hypothetical protein